MKAPLTRSKFLAVAALLLSLGISRAGIAQASSRGAAIRITGYKIDLTLDPSHNAMSAQAAVTFTALKDLTAVPFKLNPALQVSRVTDADGEPLNFARAAGDKQAIQVTPAAPLKDNLTHTWTFTYGGAFNAHGPSSATSAFHFASIGDPVSYLLYAARWFPMRGYLTDRFTMAIHVHVPANERVVGSGAAGVPHPDSAGLMVFDFNWTKPGFPGTIIAGKFLESSTSEASTDVRVYLIEEPEKPNTSEKNIAATGQSEYKELAAQFGSADSRVLNIVELPNGTAPAYWAPEIAAIAGSQLKAADPSRLLVNTIAHQWWGNDISPDTLNDAWITNGMCRFAELASVKRAAGQAAFKDAILNISASALAFAGARLADIAQYPVHSPEFQAMTYDKGAMIFRMLQWQIGDAAFEQTLRGILSRPGGTISTEDVEAIAEKASHQGLRPFFTQWIDDSGAPTLKDNWTLYRLGGKGAGYRIVGEITDNLDLFRMPVEVRVETASGTVNQRVDVTGAQTQYMVHTASLPRKIQLDPNRWLLRSNSAMQVRVHILRGQQMEAGNNIAGAVNEYREALAIDDISSLASYRLGEVYLSQRNYQAAENAFRDALHGDGLPKWTEVWSNLELGKIFDASSERERAVNQYREAMQTGDNTGGAVDLARSYLKHPYTPPKAAAP